MIERLDSGVSSNKMQMDADGKISTPGVQFDKEHKTVVNHSLHQEPAAHNKNNYPHQKEGIGSSVSGSVLVPTKGICGNSWGYGVTIECIYSILSRQLLWRVCRLCDVQRGQDNHKLIEKLEKPLLITAAADTHSEGSCGVRAVTFFQQ